MANHRLSRFAAVGIFNTIVDFVFLNTLLAVTHSIDSKTAVIAFNTLSATCVAVASFFLNRRYVFHAGHTPRHFVVRFIAITLSGLYLVQNSVIYLVLHYFHGPAEIGSNVLDAVGITGISEQFLLINSAKALATLASMLWNYEMYKRFVFQPIADKTQ